MLTRQDGTTEISGDALQFEIEFSDGARLSENASPGGSLAIGAEYRIFIPFDHLRLGDEMQAFRVRTVGGAPVLIRSLDVGLVKDPVEVENCIKAHAAVADCAVIGVPDAVWVQSVKAIVVVADGAAVTDDDIIAHCRDRMASYKKPRAVEFVDAIPRAGFAVDYDALDARFGGGGYPGGTTRSV